MTVVTGGLKSYMFQDWSANSGNGKGRALLTIFRCAQWFNQRSGVVRAIGIPVIYFYKIVSQYGFGCDFPLSLTLGPRARVYHVYGLVVNHDTIIGSDVILRNGITIGVKGSGIPGVPTIGDRVEFGSNCSVIGRVRVGNDAKVGTGAIVIRDVPDNCVAVGNPARVLPQKNDVLS